MSSVYEHRRSPRLAHSPAAWSAVAARPDAIVLGQFCRWADGNSFLEHTDPPQQPRTGSFLQLAWLLQHRTAASALTGRHDGPAFPSAPPEQPSMAQADAPVKPNDGCACFLGASSQCRHWRYPLEPS